MKLKAGVGITLIANIFFAVSQWVIISGLNYTNKTDVVGQYAFSIAISGLFLTVGQLGLRPYLLSSIVEKNEIKHIFHVRLITSFFAFFALFFFSYLFLSPFYLMLILVLGAGKIFENLSDICHGYYQKNFQIQQIVYSRIFRSLASPIIFLAIFFYTENIVLACIGILTSLILTFYLFDKKVLSQQGITFFSLIPFQHVKNIILKAYPMGIATVLVILVVNIPLFVLKEYALDVEVGVYASIFYFVAAGSLVLQSALQIIAPLLTLSIKEKSTLRVKSLVIKSYLMAGLFGTFGILLASVFGPFVLSLLYGSSFNDLGELLIIASLINFALAFQAVGGIVLTSFGIFKYQMYCMLLVIPICYFSSQLLVALIGIKGALYTGAFTSFIIAALFLFKLFEKLKEIERN